MFDQEFPCPSQLSGIETGMDFFGDFDNPGSICPLCGQEVDEGRLVYCDDCGQRICPHCVDDPDWHQCGNVYWV